MLTSPPAAPGPVLLRWLPALALLFVFASPARADLTIFESSLQKGSLWADAASTDTGIVTTIAAGDAGAASRSGPAIRLGFTQSWRSGGLAFFGSRRLQVPAASPRLRLELLTTRDKPINSFVVRLDGRKFSFGNNSGGWTLDGQPGNTRQIRRGVWHEVDIDLASLPDFRAGLSRLDGELGVLVGPAGGAGTRVYLKRIRLAAATDSGPATAGAVTLAIEPNNRQEVQAWGVATQNRPDWGKNYDITRNSESMRAIYQELGATCVRFHIDYKTWDSARAKEDLKRGILAVTSRGGTWYGLPWSPPVHLKTIKKPNGKVNKVLNRLKPGSEAEVAAWLVDLVAWLEAEGVPLPVAIGPQNEADFGPPGYPGCVYTAEQMRTAVIALRSALDAAGYRGVKVMADDGAQPGARPSSTHPDSGSLNLLGLRRGEAFDRSAALRNAVGIVGTHTYDLHNNLYRTYPGYMQSFHDATRRLNRPVWMTEWETRHEHTFDDWGVLTETFTHFNRDMAGMGFNGWFHWQVWRGWTRSDEVDDGECVDRIRAGDQFIYDNVITTKPSNRIRLRYGSDSTKMTVTVRLNGNSGPLLARRLLPRTAKGVFDSIDLPVSLPAGKHRVHVRFTSPEHWREAKHNWFKLDSGPTVEAESYAWKRTVEKWSSFTAPCFVAEESKYLVRQEGSVVQRRPLFYAFKKVWNNAPATGGTFVRLVNSDSPAFRGASREADPKSYRQDVSAFVNGQRMTVVVVNRNDDASTVDLTGLTGRNIDVFRYAAADATSVNRDMTRVGRRSIAGGAVRGLVLPPQTLHVLVSDGAPAGGG